MKALVALTLIIALAGCSKRTEKAIGDANKPEPAIETQHSTPPVVPRQLEVVTSQPPPSPEPSARELDDAASALGIARNQALPLLRREHALWEKFVAILKSDNASDVVPMLSAMAAAVQGTTAVQSNGEQLPESFLAMLGLDAGNVPGLGSVDGPSAKAKKAGFMGVGVEKLPEQHILAAAVQELAKRRPDLLTSLATERANSAVPTAADYILFNAIIDGLADSPFLETTGDASEKPRTLPFGSELMAMARKPNPIYRLIAVRTASRVETDAKGLVTFYSTFVAETDPTIQQAAIEGLEGVRDPAALDALRKFDTATKARGNADVRQTVEDAIRRLTALPLK